MSKKVAQGRKQEELFPLQAHDRLAVPLEPAVHNAHLVLLAARNERALLTEELLLLAYAKRVELVDGVNAE